MAPLFIQRLLLLVALITGLSTIGSPSNYSCDAFSRPMPVQTLTKTALVERPSRGLSAAVEVTEEEVSDIRNGRVGEVASSSPLSATKRFGINSRGAKMNEVSSVGRSYT